MKTMFASLFTIALLTGCATGHQHIVPDTAIDPQTGLRATALAVVSDQEFQIWAKNEIARQMQEKMAEAMAPNPSSTVVVEPEPTMRDLDSQVKKFSDGWVKLATQQDVRELRWMLYDLMRCLALQRNDWRNDLQKAIPSSSTWTR